MRQSLLIWSPCSFKAGSLVVYVFVSNVITKGVSLVVLVVGVRVGSLVLGSGYVWAVVAVLGVEVVTVVGGIPGGSVGGLVVIGSLDTDTSQGACEIGSILATSTGADAITARAVGRASSGVLGEAALVEAADFFAVVGVDHDDLFASFSRFFVGAGGVGAEIGAMLLDGAHTGLLAEGTYEVLFGEGGLGAFTLPDVAVVSTGTGTNPSDRFAEGVGAAFTSRVVSAFGVIGTEIVASVLGGEGGRLRGGNTYYTSLLVDLVSVSLFNNVGVNVNGVVHVRVAGGSGGGSLGELVVHVVSGVIGDASAHGVVSNNKVGRLGAHGEVACGSEAEEGEGELHDDCKGSW